MVKLLVKGEKVVIGKLNEGLNHLTLDFIYSSSYDFSFDLDIFVFMINEKNEVNKNHIIFYNNPVDMDKSIQYSEDDTKTFEINLNKIPKNIQKLAFACSVYKKTDKFEPKKINLSFQIFDKMTKMKMFEIQDEMDIGNKESMILGDIYQYKGLWKFNTATHQHEENVLNLIKRFYSVDIY